MIKVQFFNMLILQLSLYYCFEEKQGENPI